MKIVILDGYTENPGDLSWEGFQKLGELTVYDRTPRTDRFAHRDETRSIRQNPHHTRHVDRCKNIKYIGLLATATTSWMCRSKGKRHPRDQYPGIRNGGRSGICNGMLLEICQHVAHHSTRCMPERWTQNPDWCFWDYGSSSLQKDMA